MQSFSILDFFNLCAGLAIFLYGMQQGEKNLKQIGGSQLQKIITLITRHRISAYFAGFSITLITQSSSATTVMLVGLASAQLMTLGQSLGMILGSDLATTITVSLFAFKFYQIAPFLIAVGYLISLVSNSKEVSGSGKLLFSLGFIFFGMHMMADSVSSLQTEPFCQKMISSSFNNSWYGLFAGTIITALIHSSAATLAIVITLAQSYQDINGYSLSLSQLFPIVLGANLGTCATALITTVRSELEGTRVAWAHFFFKFIGIAVVFPFSNLIQLAGLLNNFSTPMQIASLHMFFNFFISILFLPFLHYFERFILFLIKPSRDLQSRYHLKYLSDEQINLPGLALSQSTKEVTRMGEQVEEMLKKSHTMITTFSTKEIQVIDNLDDEVDFLYEKIIDYLTRMSKQELDIEQTSQVYRLIMITADLEHVGDTVSKSISYLLQKIESNKIFLSPEGRNEISDFYLQTIMNFEKMIHAFSVDDDNLIQNILDKKAEFKIRFGQLFENHMKRLYLGKKESLQTTSIHKDLLEEIQRVNHYTFRIAHTILKDTRHFNISDKTTSSEPANKIIEKQTI